MKQCVITRGELEAIVNKAASVMMMCKSAEGHLPGCEQKLLDKCMDIQFAFNPLSSKRWQILLEE